MRRSDARSREQYLREAVGAIDLLFNCVSLCLWTPFNEAWGQFDAIAVWQKLKALDDTRLYDHASGWQDMGGGDLQSRHIYFRKVRLKNDKKRILALTEFGGYAFLAERKRRSIFSYRKYRTRQAFMQGLNQLYLRQIVPAVKKDGLCAVVYTQLSDVETEVNGIFTADPDNDSFYLWLFNGQKSADKLPQQTTLQRKAAAFVASGGKIGTGFGILENPAISPSF